MKIDARPSAQQHSRKHPLGAVSQVQDRRKILLSTCLWVGRNMCANATYTHTRTCETRTSLRDYRSVSQHFDLVLGNFFPATTKLYSAAACRAPQCQLSNIHHYWRVLVNCSGSKSPNRTCRARARVLHSVQQFSNFVVLHPTKMCAKVSV